MDDDEGYDVGDIPWPMDRSDADDDDDMPLIPEALPPAPPGDMPGWNCEYLSYIVRYFVVL